MQQNTALHIGDIVKGYKFTYTIQAVLGQGSFGITYLASTNAVLSGPLGNIETEVKVAIKEFFMKEFSSRHENGTVTEMTDGSLVQNYSRKFRKEAENLAKLSHPGIVKVLEVFEANNTCYYAMQYIAGGSLDAYVKSRGGLPEEEAVEYIRQIGDAVQYMHDHKMLHLDLKPGNVMRTEDGKKMLLIDFGLSKQYTSNGEPESSTTIGLGTPGYAPLEQSNADRDKDFAPTLDVYALGATFFKLLTGETPPKASDVLNDGLPIEKLQKKGVSQTRIKAIEKAMESRKGMRAKSIKEFLALLDGTTKEDDDEETIVSGTEDKGKINTKYDKEKKPAKSEKLREQHKQEESQESEKKPFPKWLFWLFAGVAVAVLVAVLLNRSGKPDVSDLPQIDSTSVVSEAVPEKPATGKPSSSSTKPETPAKPEAPAVVELKSISLSKTTLELEEGQSATLTVKYSPSNASDKTTTWKSSNTNVAKVSSGGKVTAVKSGSAAIIATCQGKDAYCNVTVNAKEVQPSKPEKVASQTAQTASATTVTHNGHEWVDLGLSVKWATCNVGASTPSDYGSYFAWGETSPKSDYSWSTLKYCNDATGDSFSKYNQNNGGTIDNKTRLDLSDDAASANWGGSWRMPTHAEFQELIDKCIWTWTTLNGKNGYKVVSKSNGNSIFLPAAGWRGGTSLYFAGSDGDYWSSSLYESRSCSARYLYFYSDYHSTYYYYRRIGQSVRPVLR